MTKIIIVGYPKSGTTWVTRLLAELVQCPVIGFWNEPYHREIATEGLARKSEFQCFKSHHQLHELGDRGTLNNTKIIYLIRDPRDIAISGAYYFFMKRWPYAARFLTRYPLKSGNRSNIINPLLILENYCIRQMVDVVLNGSPQVHIWVRIPWKTHYKPYLENHCFFVRYEDLLDTPEIECMRIMGYLGLKWSRTHMLEAIEKQSFENRKAAFLGEKDVSKATFMRAGISGQWKQALSSKQKAKFIEVLSCELRELAYLDAMALEF